MTGHGRGDTRPRLQPRRSELARAGCRVRPATTFGGDVVTAYPAESSVQSPRAPPATMMTARTTAGAGVPSTSIHPCRDCIR